MKSLGNAPMIKRGCCIGLCLKDHVSVRDTNQPNATHSHKQSVNNSVLFLDTFGLVIIFGQRRTVCSMHSSSSLADLVLSCCLLPFCVDFCKEGVYFRSHLTVFDCFLGVSLLSSGDVHTMRVGLEAARVNRKTTPHGEGGGRCGSVGRTHATRNGRGGSDFPPCLLSRALCGGSRWLSSFGSALFRRRQGLRPTGCLCDVHWVMHGAIDCLPLSVARGRGGYASYQSTRTNPYSK